MKIHGSIKFNILQLLFLIPIGCGEAPPTISNSQLTGGVLMKMSTPPSELARLVITISGDDISDPITTEFSENLYSDSFKISGIPIGESRNIDAFAYNSSNDLIASGGQFDVAIYENEFTEIQLILEIFTQVTASGNLSIDISYAYSPKIDHIISTPAIALAGGSVFLSALVSNQDETPLTYMWSSPLGSFDDPMSTTPTWIAPASDGDVEITLHIQNSTFEDTHTLVITVVNTQFATPGLNDIIINEILADPPEGLDGDANNDGSRSNSDEFIELINLTATTIDISELQIWDVDSLRHTIDAGTILEPFEPIIIFGGATPTGFSQKTQIASSGSLSLNNSGDTVSLIRSDGTTIHSVTYNSMAGNDVSITRSPEFTGDFVGHDTASNGELKYSPGVQADGTPFQGND